MVKLNDDYWNTPVHNYQSFINLISTSPQARVKKLSELTQSSTSSSSFLSNDLSQIYSWYKLLDESDKPFSFSMKWTKPLFVGSNPSVAVLIQVRLFLLFFLSFFISFLFFYFFLLRSISPTSPLSPLFLAPLSIFLSPLGELLLSTPFSSFLPLFYSPFFCSSFLSSSSFVIPIRIFSTFKIRNGTNFFICKGLWIV